MGQINEIDFEELQDQTLFVEYNEFSAMKEESGLMVINACYNDEGELAVNNLESQALFNERLEDIVENIQKKYPFVGVIVKKPSDIQPINKSEKKFGLFEMYLCVKFNAKTVKKVIYSKDLLALLPTSKIVLENMKRCIHTVNLVVKLSLNCQSDLSPHIIKSQYSKQNQPTLENIQLSLHSKEKNTSGGGTSSMRSSVSQREEFVNVINAVRSREGSCLSLGLSPEVKGDPHLQTQNLNQTGNLSLKQGIQQMKNQMTQQGQSFSSYVNQLSITQNSKNTKLSRQNSTINRQENNMLSSLNGTSVLNNQKSNSKQIKLNTVVDSNGVAQFKNIVSHFQFYELKIHSSLYTKTQNMVIDLFELQQRQGNSENLEVSIVLERNDICICDVVVTNNSKGVMQDAKVLISDQPINEEELEKNFQSVQENNEVIEISFDASTRKFSFLAHPGFYYVLVYHQNYYSQERQIQIRQGQNMKVEVDMVPVTQSLVKLRAFDIINQCTIPSADVVIKDVFDNVLHYGKTNEIGQIECRLKLSKKFRISISKNFEYMHFIQTIEPHINKIIDNHYTVYMIPKNPTVSKQFEVLAYYPHKQFDIDFSAKCSDGSQINKFNTKQLFSSSCINYYDEIEFKDSKLIEFSIQNIKNHLNYEFEVFSRSCISDKKLEEYQNITNAYSNQQSEIESSALLDKKYFKRSAINMNSYFINSRVTSETKSNKFSDDSLKETKTPQIIPKQKTFESDQTLKIFFIYKNSIQLFKEINTDIVLQPLILGSFISYSKMFTEIVHSQFIQQEQENDENIQPIHATKIPNQNLTQKLIHIEKEPQIKEKQNFNTPSSENKKQAQFLFSQNRMNNFIS